MTPEEKLRMVAHILDKGKLLASDRFPQPSKEVTAAWADAFSDMFDSFPPQIWSEAVVVWSMEMATDRMVTPRNIRDAAYVVRDRWLSDRVKGPWLRKWNETRIEARTTAMIEGRLPNELGR